LNPTENFSDNTEPFFDEIGVRNLFREICQLVESYQVYHGINSGLQPHLFGFSSCAGYHY